MLNKTASRPVRRFDGFRFLITVVLGGVITLGAIASTPGQVLNPHNGWDVPVASEKLQR